jgi:hypothetical protein
MTPIIKLKKVKDKFEKNLINWNNKIQNSLKRHNKKL